MSAAMARALDAIRAEFGAAGAHRCFKAAIRRVFRDPTHHAVRARYRTRAAMVGGWTLAGAIAAVETRYRAERKAFQLMSALGHGNRLSLEVLRELRLILRFLRARGMDGEFSAIVGDLLDGRRLNEAAE